MWGHSWFSSLTGVPVWVEHGPSVMNPCLCCLHWGSRAEASALTLPPAGHVCGQLLLGQPVPCRPELQGTVRPRLPRAMPVAWFPWSVDGPLLRAFTRLPHPQCIG